MLLLIDNYDSFVHNLARYFQRLGQETLVLRNDVANMDYIRRLAPRAVVISPGPRTPAEAGCSVDVIRQLEAETPILGVCLGHQAIAAAYGGKITRAPDPRHGRTSIVSHTGAGLFANLPTPLTVCRYHSLVADEPSLPTALRVTARAEDGTVMALEHVSRPVFGVQFHPEAALTEHGYQLLANFLNMADCRVETNIAAVTASENRQPLEASPLLPPDSLTF